MKLRKLLLAIMAGNCLMTNNVFAGEWKTSPSGWWYQNDDGTYWSDGWQWIDGKCYYFNENGYCLIDTITPDGQLVDENGAWIVNGIVQTTTFPNSMNDNLLYKEILDKYYIAISQHWSGEQLLNANLCYLCRYYDEISEIGYSFIDINKDGTNELVIGESFAEGGYTGMMFDMYTIVDNRIVQVVSSGERDRYYLCSDYKIANEGSSGAANSQDSYYYFDGTKLVLIEAVIYDGDYNEVNPWFYSTTGFTKDCYIPISDDLALQIINSYTYMNINFTPFSKY